MTLSVTSRASSFQKAWTAVAIFTWPGALFMYSLTSFFGFRTLAMNARALAFWAFAGIVLCFVITGPPAMPAGVKPRAGTWPACVMYLTIWLRSIAKAIARRWFTSLMFFTLNP